MLSFCFFCSQFASKELQFLVWSFHYCSFLVLSQFVFESHFCCLNSMLLLFSLHLLWKQLRVMTITFKIEGFNYNTKAADIVSRYSNLHIITVSSSVALLLDRCAQMICKSRISQVEESAYQWHLLRLVILTSSQEEIHWREISNVCRCKHQL